MPPPKFNVIVQKMQKTSNNYFFQFPRGYSYWRYYRRICTVGSYSIVNKRVLVAIATPHCRGQRLSDIVILSFESCAFTNILQCLVLYISCHVCNCVKLGYAVKPGTCPQLRGKQSCPSCEYDADCYGRKKCCAIGAYFGCMNPVWCGTYVVDALLMLL